MEPTIVTAGVSTQANLTSGNDAYNAIRFVVDQVLAGLWTISVVQVVSSTNSGSLALTGTVNVQPMVNKVDGQGNGSKRGIINGLTYFRMQGGANAIIMDPVAGDRGLALHASRDISLVKATKKISNPGSFRKFSASDGIYLGGILNGIPTQWVQFIGSKLVANAVTEMDLQIGGSTVVAITSAGATITGTLTVTGDAHIDGKDFITHEHIDGGGVGNSGPVA